VNRYLVIACLFAVVVGCAENEAKAPPPLQPTQSDADEPRDDGDAMLVAQNEESSAEPEAPCRVTFTKDVMPKLVATCGTAACHAETTEPFVDDTAPQVTYEGLLDFGFDDESWTDPHPADSKLDEPSLGAAIDAWRKCGASFD
jgi:hypothetical protein